MPVAKKPLEKKKKPFKELRFAAKPELAKAIETRLLDEADQLFLEKHNLTVERILSGDFLGHLETAVDCQIQKWNKKADVELTNLWNEVSVMR